MAIHIGREKSGWKGLVVAGIVYNARSTYNWGFAYFYKKYGQQPKRKYSCMASNLPLSP
jgi:chromate transporter